MAIFTWNILKERISNMIFLIMPSMIFAGYISIFSNNYDNKQQLYSQTSDFFYSTQKRIGSEAVNQLESAIIPFSIWIKKSNQNPTTIQQGNKTDPVTVENHDTANAAPADLTQSERRAIPVIKPGFSFTAGTVESASQLSDTERSTRESHTRDLEVEEDRETMSKFINSQIQK